jgi:ELWxxDGT repeat protein
MRKNLRYYHLNLSSTSRFLFALVLISSTFVFHSTYAQVQLLKDIEQVEEPTYNEYRSLVNGIGRVYFISHNELWKSNGTDGTTQKLKAFRSISNLTMVGTTLYFTGNDGTSGTELWRSNGTPGNTVRVKDIVPGAGGSSPYNLTAGNGVIFFVANNNQNGKELWKSDGTAAGTVLVKDIMRVVGSSLPNYLTFMNGNLYFSANDGQHGYELWRSDGTAAGTVMVKDVKTGTKVSSHPSGLANLNGTLYFAAADNTTGNELWKSDGTFAGTVRVKDIRTGSGSSGVENLINVQGKFFFTANDGIHGDELWKTDGTAAGTVLVKDLNPGSAGSNSTSEFGKPMRAFTDVNGILYFLASDELTEFIYRSDGTAAGTFIIDNTRGPGIDNAAPEFTYLNGKVYFLNGGNPWGFYVWVMAYNGTNPVPMTRFLEPDDYYQTYHQEILRFNSALYTFGRLPNDDYNESGYKLIRSDGSADGTSVIKDAFVSNYGSEPQEMLAVGDYVFFKTTGYQADNKYMWVTDGTPEGTREITNMPFEYEWAVVNNELYYTQYSSQGGWELWKTKGPAATSVLLIQSSSGSGEEEQYPKDMTDVNGTLYYYDILGQLWKSNGTPESTFIKYRFKKILSITNVAGNAFVLVEPDGGGLELWKATPAGVAKIKTIRTAGSNPEYELPAVAINNELYFVAKDNVNGYEVWRSNGIAAGTYMMGDLNTSDVDYVNDIVYLGKYNNRLFVSAFDNTGTWALYKATGTTTFEKVHNMGPVDLMVEHNGLLIVFPFHSDAPLVREVWSTNGTSDGTIHLTTMWADIEIWHNPMDYAIMGDALFFGSYYFQELYRTDGTACGTFAVETGVQSTFPMETLGNSLVFGGKELQYGREPYIYYNIPTTDSCPEQTQAVAVNRLVSDETKSGPVLKPYPNPFTNDFTMRIDGSESDQIEMAVFSHTGIPVERFDKVIANTDYDHIGAAWPKGIYLVKISRQGVLTTHMVVKN